jgi:hypothetical protein
MLTIIVYFVVGYLIMEGIKNLLRNNTNPVIITQPSKESIKKNVRKKTSKPQKLPSLTKSTIKKNKVDSVIPKTKRLKKSE